MDPWLTAAEQATTDATSPAFALARLAALAARLDAAADRRERTLLARCLFSTYLDCVDRGAGAQARALLDFRHAEPSGVAAAR